MAALIRSVFGSASSTALCIAWRESRFDPYARNPNSSASGVFQLTRIWWAGRWSFNPFSAVANVYHAHLMYLDYGWGPWGGGC